MCNECKKNIWIFHDIGLLDDYDALVSTATQISELVKPLKEYFKFNLTWDCFVKKLYQIYVYNDALVQNNVPTFFRQVKGNWYFREIFIFCDLIALWFLK